MTWRDELEKDVGRRSDWVLDLEDTAPQVGDRRAASIIATSHSGAPTLVVELGADEQGRPYVICRALDRLGKPIPPTVLDAGDTVMVSLGAYA